MAENEKEAEERFHIIVIGHTHAQMDDKQIQPYDEFNRLFNKFTFKTLKRSLSLLWVANNMRIEY